MFEGVFGIGLAGAGGRGRCSAVPPSRSRVGCLRGRRDRGVLTLGGRFRVGFEGRWFLPCGVRFLQGWAGAVVCSESAAEFLVAAGRGGFRRSVRRRRPGIGWGRG